MQNCYNYIGQDKCLSNISKATRNHLSLFLLLTLAAFKLKLSFQISRVLKN